MVEMVAGILVETMEGTRAVPMVETVRAVETRVLRIPF
jgi:hypothetical protein